jgi:hypothetical protein
MLVKCCLFFHGYHRLLPDSFYKICGRLVEQKHDYLFHSNPCYELGHSLLFCCSLTWMSNKLPSVYRTKLKLTYSFRCDQSHNFHKYDFGHTVVLLKLDFDVQQSDLNLLNQSPSLALVLGVTKIIAIIVMNSVTVWCPA